VSASGQYDPQRAPRLQSRQPYVELRRVDIPGAATDQDRLMPAALKVRVGAGLGTGDPATGAVRQRLGRPSVTLKLATSLDGCIALADGTSRWRERYPAMLRAASSARTPSVTAMPASRNRASPMRSVRGSGSPSATTTRATPAATSRSAHAGPRAETCAQGSSVV
jgi:diaminohydroxyphosphoribosylaminopyrimidine deaminase/5-amino-6-(5-phosphoribosylamino)uracil reductase